MAGRGRGKGKFSFDVSKVGIQRGEALPASLQQPPPLYLPIKLKPLPLNNSEKEEYLVAVKHEFRGLMKDSDYFIKPDIVKKDMERYSDRYSFQNPATTSPYYSKWEPVWKRFPEELRERKRKVRANSSTPNLKRSRPAPNIAQDVVEKLDELAKKGDNDNEEEDEEEGNGEGAEEIEYDEEEQEEDNDYLVCHYDDGEEVGFQDDDDMDEGPTY
ncbi:DNA-directed RNA polymerase III subunit RPC7-like [Xenia sp. Carnegie-2017]|uniref:DNA-directed RNA polymerase III subunit RPC7-like n=1 Tax=Xenia sp. Carnegie-2017 TaxID=2897299 RepID=UPI001F03A88B|nr:DNA-directed RNA polymerase III subunit RPC7-like [Xenia sp. Carnegie-2017]